MPRRGYLLITSDQGRVERDTFQCRHCNRAVVVEPGSGKRRGWCLKCAGPTCGSRGCETCVPFLKRLERAESKRALFKELDHGH